MKTLWLLVEYDTVEPNREKVHGVYKTKDAAKSDLSNRIGPERNPDDFHRFKWSYFSEKRIACNRSWTVFEIQSVDYFE